MGQKRHLHPSLWHSEGRKSSTETKKGKTQASKGPKGRPGLGCLVGFWPPGARLAALGEVPPGFNGRYPLFEAKTSCRQNWTRSSSAEPGWIKQGLFLNYCLFLFAKIPLLGSGVISKAQLLQGINVWHSCLGHFFSSLELRSQLGSYLSFLVHGHIILACKKYTKKCVNSRQNSQHC